MGDASSVDPNMGADPMAGGDPSMGEAPAEGPGPMAGEDPMMGGGDEPMPGDGEDMGGDEGSGDDSTMSLFDQLSDTDKEAARSYIESMLNKDESQPENQGPEGGDMPQMPMESVIFTKGQLKKLNEDIGLGMDAERDEKRLTKRTDKTNKKVKSSPFNSPKFE